MTYFICICLLLFCICKFDLILEIATTLIDVVLVVAACIGIYYLYCVIF